MTEKFEALREENKEKEVDFVPNGEVRTGVGRIKRRISHLLAMIALGASGVCGTACPTEARAGTSRDGRGDESSVFEEEDESGYYAMEDLLGRLATRGEAPENSLEALGALLDVRMEMLRNSACEGFDNCVEPAEDIFERLVRLAVSENPEETLKVLIERRNHSFIHEEHIILAQDEVNRILRKRAEEENEKWDQQGREIEEKIQNLDEFLQRR